MELTEEQILSLLEKVANRNAKMMSERAIETLYIEFSLPVRNFIWKTITQDPSHIEEVVQDTFFEVWKHPERFRGESKFKTWLLGIARYKALDSLRKRGKDHEPLEDIEENLVSNDIPVTEMIQKEQIHSAVKFCLDNLSANGKLTTAHKEVLHLAYIEDQDMSEMAQLLNCLESTIKTRLHYARIKIKSCLKKCLFGGTDLE
jgi:RNA polymerase sigma-70 factor, ECF subfamily